MAKRRHSWLQSLVTLVLIICMVLIMGGKVVSAGAATFQDAVKAAIANGGGTVTITEDSTIDETIEIPEGISITIKDDGSSHNVTITENAFLVKGSLTIDAKNTTFDATSCESEADTGKVVTIDDNASFTLKDGTIKCGSNSAANSGAVVLMNKSSFTMDGGIIRDAYSDVSAYTDPDSPTYLNPSSLTLNAAVNIVGGGSTFTMNGGEIAHNTSEKTIPTSSGGWTSGPSASALCARVDDDEKAQYGESNIYINGGSIHDNVGGEGPAGYIRGNVNVVISDGEIYNNESGGRGGAMRIIRGATFKMLGGDVHDNKARSHGGAFYFDNAGDTTFKAGAIHDNVSTEGMGGGISLYTSNENATFENTLVTDNTASKEGGGIWNCPTGAADLFATEGIAIFDNDATGENAVGDDYVNKIGKNGNEAVGSSSINERMLGGGLVSYYNDGGYSKEDGNDYMADSSIARFDESNPGDSVTSIPDDTPIALHTEASDEAKATARENATLLIYNNSAVNGGGIGSNGMLTAGSNQLWEFSVDKIWEDVPEDEQKEITVFLKSGDTILDNIVLNKDNNWNASFENLPIPSSTVGGLTVVEGAMVNGEFLEESDYKVTYELVKTDMDTHTVHFKITNSTKPDDSDDQDEEDEDDDEEDEVDEDDSDSDDAPDTGDGSNLEHWVFLMGASVISIVILARRRREHTK